MNSYGIMYYYFYSIKIKLHGINIHYYPNVNIR